MDILGDQLEVTAAGFGEILLPEVIKIIKQVNSFLETLQNLDDGTKRLLVTIGVAGAGGATLIAGITAVTLAIGAMNAALAISVGATGVKGLTLAFSGLARFLIGPQALLIPLGLAAAGLWKVYNAAQAADRSITDLSKTFRAIGAIRDYNDLIEKQREELLKNRKVLEDYVKGAEAITILGSPAIPSGVTEGIEDINRQLSLLK